MSLIRTRWAALGAAVAVTLGGGGIGLVSATNPADATTFIAITPCRVMDTRPEPAFNVGPKSSPLGPDEEHDVTAVGSSGDCTAVPANAAAVSLNVTALNATQSTFLTIYASNVTRPDASSLNPTPGDPPTPNAVTTELSPGGQFTVFNRFGNVDVIADINGYYVDHNHDDRYYTRAEADASLASKPDATDVYTKAEIDAAIAAVHPIAASAPVSGRCNADETGTGEARDGEFDGCSNEIELGITTEHSVLLVAEIGWGQFQSSGPVKGSCRLERNGVEVPGSTITMGETVKTTEESNAGGIDNRRLNWAGVTAVSGSQSGSGTYRVACREVVGNAQFNEISLSGILVSP